MLLQLHLREYDDADIIAYLDQLERGEKSRTIREALRIKMRTEGFEPVNEITPPAYLPHTNASAKGD